MNAVWSLLLHVYVVLILSLLVLIFQMSSRQMKEDLENLLDMEVKLRLLETEGLSIPTEAPPIPKMPDNFHFAYTTST